MKTLKKLVMIMVAVSIAASLLTIGASAVGNTMAYGAATVSGPSLNLRSGPGTTHSVVAQLNEGDIVVILERTDSEWYKINYHGLVGYVNVPFLKDILVAENFNAQGKVTGDYVNMRAKPDTASDKIETYASGTVLTVVGINNGWYKVAKDGQTGYIRSDYMEIISGYSPSSSSSATVTSTATKTVPAANVTLGRQMVDFALGYLGSKYVYGGASPSGFDCSGFSSYVYKHFGYTITRTASGQYRNDGVKIPKSELYAGDLVFFSSNGSSVTHVGIYIGNNEFIHASTPSSGVVISRLDSTYYINVWWGAKRII